MTGYEVQTCGVGCNLSTKEATKVQKIAQSGHTVYQISHRFPQCHLLMLLPFRKLVSVGVQQCDQILH